jgi:S-DNA-T family DNA segregation ATPase FtsK/SpoIIIE
MLDIPSKQFQAPYEYDFIRDGHLAIYGSSCTGKSTLVQTILFSLALRFSPEMFQTYILDFGGGGLASSAQMPHCMRYVTDSNVVEVASVMERLESTIRTRHDLFVKNNCVSYEAYNSSHETKLPLILFVIDNYSVLKEKMTAVEVNFLQWIQLARSCGVFLIVTGNSKNPFSYKLADHISNRIVLNMIDPGAYRDILCVKIPIAPAEGKGRGLVLIDRISTEVQFAVPFNTDEEIDRDIHMQAIYEKMREVVADSKPVGSITVNLQIIPDEQRPPSVKVSGSTSCLSPLEDLSDSLVIGYDSKTGKPYGFDLTQPTKVFVGTRNQTDYSTIVVSRLVKNNPNKKVFVWSPKSVGSFGSGAIIIEDIDEWILAMYKNVSMEDKQKVIFVVDGFREFFSRISEVSELRMENGLLEEAAFSVVTFDSVDSVEEWERYTVTGLYVHLVRSVKGVIVGGQVTGDLESMLASSVRDIPVEYRKIPLLNNQVFMYDEEQYAVVEIEEEAGDD